VPDTSVDGRAEQLAPTTTRYVALDGLRGVAALAVLLFHLENYGLYPFPGHIHAVDLFFMMSGFVIAAAYNERVSKLGLVGFMEQRVARLYPTYALSLLIAVAFMAFIAAISKVHVDVRPTLLSLPFQLLYLPSPPALVPPHQANFLLNGPGWSLLWELAVNVLYAIMLSRLSRRLLTAVVAVGALALGGLLLFGVPIDGGSDWPTFYVGPLRVLFGFPLGMLIYRLKRPAFDTPFLFLALAVVLTLFLPSALSVFVVLPIVVWLGTGSRSNSGALSLLGELSYPLYAIHVPLFGPLNWIGGRVFHLAGIAQGLFDAGAVVLAAYLVYVFWDRPARTALRRYLQSRRLRKWELGTTSVTS
jgi:peptidoglycan/LPS O-acetylase OafA/YrhL